MTSVIEQEIDAYDYGKVRYQVNPQHRDSNPNKSQWDITVENELYVFRCAAYYKWFTHNKAWALFLNNGEMHYLGTVPGNRRTFIAKFVVDNNHNAWHGYPADHISKSQDIPDGAILQAWVQSKLLTKPKMRKIMQGQPCSI